jgi:hypothetical protein
MRPLARAGILAGILAVGAPPVAAQRYLEGPEGPYRGTVVDAETGAPLEGAVVVAIWSRERIYPLHSKTEHYAAREVLTDAAGAFVIDARQLEESAPARTLPPYFQIYFPGYGSRLSRLFTVRGFQRGTFSTGLTVGLPRARTREERLEVIRAGLPVLVPDEQVPNMIRLMNVERVALGLQPVHLGGGH